MSLAVHIMAIIQKNAKTHTITVAIDFESPSVDAIHSRFNNDSMVVIDN